MAFKGGVIIMSFYLEEEVEVKFEFNYKQLAEKIVDFCLDYIDFP